jgi:hypothetical protein
MAVTLNASTSSGFIQTADTSGILQVQSNGTTQFTVDSTGAYGQVERATAVASTSGTSIDFTGLPSWVKRITVMFQGVSLSGTANPLIQIGDSGGFETTGYVSSGSSVTDSGATTVTGSTTGFIIRSATASNTLSGHMVLTNISGNIWIASYSAKNSTSSCSVGGGDKTLSDILTQVRITTTNGTDTFDAGSINILYEG